VQGVCLLSVNVGDGWPEKPTAFHIEAETKITKL